MKRTSLSNIILTLLVIVYLLNFKFGASEEYILILYIFYVLPILIVYKMRKPGGSRFWMYNKEDINLLNYYEKISIKKVILTSLSYALINIVLTVIALLIFYFYFGFNIFDSIFWSFFVLVFSFLGSIVGVIKNKSRKGLYLDEKILDLTLEERIKIAEKESDEELIPMNYYLIFSIVFLILVWIFFDFLIAFGVWVLIITSEPIVD